jgi:UDP:flavonoid glycosyltransferase YjiC (YdhE family)
MCPPDRRSIALPNPDTTSLRAAIGRVLADSGIRAAAGRIAHEIGTMSSMHHAIGKIVRLSAG